MTLINTGLNEPQGMIILKNCSVLISNYGSSKITKYDFLPSDPITYEEIYVSVSNI